MSKRKPLTCHTDRNFKTVFTSTVGRQTTICPGIRQTHRLEDQRVDAILVHNDLVRPITMDRLVVVIPANLRVRSSNHYAVQPCSLALGNLEVCRRFVEDRLDKDFRGDVCGVVISPTVSLWIRLSANQRRKQFNQSE